VKLRGFRIELGEVEAQLLSQAEIRDAVVVLDESTEEGQLVAYVVASDGNAIDTESARKALNESLPNYMVPRQVSRHDNFFSLGGHSLLIIRFIAELQARDLSSDVRAVFENPVLTDLAIEISQSKQPYFQAPANLIPTACTVLTPELLTLVTLDQSQIDGLVKQIPGGAANIQDIYPLGPLQEGILFHHLLGSPELGDTYIMPLPLSLPNQQYADRFIRALNYVVARHDVLRTAIFWDDLPRPVQVVLRDSPIVKNELTLDPSQDTVAQLRAHIAPGKLWMDLRQAPLLRLDMATDPHSDQVFMILYEHHIINDHIGLEILISEVEEYLRAE